MTELKKKKEELLGILTAAEHDAQSLISKGREIIQTGQFISDLSRYNKEFVQLIPDDSYIPADRWENQLFAWQNVHKQVDVANSSHNLVLTDSSSTSAAVSASSIISTMVISTLPQDTQDKAIVIFHKFEQLMEQSDLFKKIGDEIHRLGVSTTSSGKASPLSLLKQAEQAFKAPSVDEASPSAVLIPLREAINGVFVALLPKRLQQEETGGNQKKLLSICKQCSRDGVDSKQIENLAKKAHDLNDILSGAKQKKLSRDQVREFMNRGLVFLLAFLQMLDEQKMRI